MPSACALRRVAAPSIRFMPWCGTRVLPATAPTAPPCFCCWQRSSPSHIQRKFYFYIANKPDLRVWLVCFSTGKVVAANFIFMPKALALGELSSSARLRGRGRYTISHTQKRLLYGKTQQPFFFYLLFVLILRFLFTTQLFDALFLALDMGPGPAKAFVGFTPAGKRIKRKCQAKNVQQCV